MFAEAQSLWNRLKSSLKAVIWKLYVHLPVTQKKYFLTKKIYDTSPDETKLTKTVVLTCYPRDHKFEYLYIIF